MIHNRTSHTNTSKKRSGWRKTYGGVLRHQKNFISDGYTPTMRFNYAIIELMKVRCEGDTGFSYFFSRKFCECWEFLSVRYCVALSARSQTSRRTIHSSCHKLNWMSDVSLFLDFLLLCLIRQYTIHPGDLVFTSFKFPSLFIHYHSLSISTNGDYFAISLQRGISCKLKWQCT